MARISGVSKESLPEDLQPLYERFTQDYGDFSNQARVLARSPEAFAHLYGLIDHWRAQGSLPQRLVEIAVVTASRVNACAYCIGHHGTALVAHGLEAETVDRILDPEPPGLVEKELLVRDYARDFSERAWGIRDDVFTRLKKHFSETEIVELTIRIGLCTLFNKFNQALQIETEEAVAEQVRTTGLSTERLTTG